MLQANPVRLGQHKDIVLQELRAARELCGRLERAHARSSPEDAWRYDRLIRQAETLERYFQAMADQMDLMEAELIQLSQDISRLLEEAMLGADRAAAFLSGV